MAPQVIAMYSQWYALPSNDPFQGNYQTVLSASDPNNTNIGPAALLEEVLSSTEIPQAFAMICMVGNQPAIYVLHQLAKFAAQLGVPAMAWDN